MAALKSTEPHICVALNFCHKGEQLIDKGAIAPVAVDGGGRIENKD